MGTEKQNGFTIIEVLIVVVIIGVMGLIVFLAIPQLQKSRRDTERKQFVTSIPAQYDEYFKNNREYPNDAADRTKFINDYLIIPEDPRTGAQYAIDFRDSADPNSDIPPLGTIYIQQNHWCNSGKNTDGSSNPIADTTQSSPTDIVAWIGAEAGQFICVDNNQ